MLWYVSARNNHHSKTHISPYLHACRCTFSHSGLSPLPLLCPPQSATIRVCPVILVQRRGHCSCYPSHLRACHLPVLFSLSDCLETSTALNFQDTRPSWFPVSHWLILPFLLRWLLLNKFQTWMKKSSVCLSFLSPSSPSGSSHLFFRNFSTIFIQDHLHTCVNLDSLTFGFLPHAR